jgi:hypothetical protein
VASTRKFYRTVVTVEILSEDPFDGTQDLEYIDWAITDGDCSGRKTVTVDNAELDGLAAAALLVAQGSDPEFFGLTEEGEDVEESA